MENAAAPAHGSHSLQSHDKRLFWGCFIALIATAFGFIVRALIINDWGTDFNLSETQKGELLGVGLWPFAISIIVFSLIIDRIGYRNAMIFGLVCHVVSAVVTIFATGYWMLYIGTFIVALGNGTVEAYINPVVATIFSREKTKWLNILHAGWPGGLVLGGILAIAMGASVSWQVKVALILIPTLVYAVMLWNEKFPMHERVAAGVPYRDMLAEVGVGGAFICTALIMIEIGRVFGLSLWLVGLVVLVLVSIYGYYTRSFGRPMFLLMLVIMMPLATTELGVDSWITDLMTPEFRGLGISAGWILVYTSAIMMILRFFAGPIVHRISPLGLLAASATIAAIGLFFLSNAAGIAILLAATLYGVGKTFFWPTTLGVVAEQFPRGGALTLNAVAGVGMLAVGIVGNPFLGYFQDSAVNSNLVAYDEANNTELHDTYVTIEKAGAFGRYEALDGAAVAAAPEYVQQAIADVQSAAKKDALRTVAIFPIFMLLCYLGLIAYFRAKGGYKPVQLTE
jgi:MFS family permease